MKKLAIALHVTTDGAFSGAEAFFPEPKLGNLKDPAKIAEKTKEHYDKCADEAGDNPLLADIVSAKFVLAEAGNTSATTDFKYVLEQELFSADGPILVQLSKMDKAMAKLHGANVIVGVHPTTHLRMLRNQLLRMDHYSPAPEIFTPHCLDYKVINPWREVQAESAGGDWRTCVQALGWDSQGQLHDSLRLARALHLF